MDSLAQVLSRTPEFSDVIMLAILKQETGSRMEKMVADHRLPLLADAPEVKFQSTFGVSGERSVFLFNSRGCLVGPDLVVRPIEPGELDRLVGVLRNVSR